MKILITGAAGFLGMHLIETILRESTHDIIVLTSQEELLHERFPEAGTRLTVIRISDWPSVSFQTVDILINCAFPRNEDGTKMADGLCFIANILKKATDEGVGAVINISSQSVYSQSRTEPATEQTPLNLESKYAVGKYATELLTNTLCAGIPHTNLRLASLIGAGFDQRVPNKMIERVLAEESLVVLTGPQYYGFLDVRDAASAITAMLRSDSQTWAEVYNLGSSLAYTLEDIASAVCAICSESLGMPITYQTELSEKQFNSALDSCLFYNNFHYQPTIDIKDTLGWILENKTRHSFY